MYGTTIQHRAAIHYLHFQRSLRRVAKLYGVGKSSVARWAYALDRRVVPRPKPNRVSVARRIAPKVAASLRQNPFLTIEALLSVLGVSSCSFVSGNRALRGHKNNNKLAAAVVEYR